MAVLRAQGLPRPLRTAQRRARPLEGKKGQRWIIFRLNAPPSAAKHPPSSFQDPGLVFGCLGAGSTLLCSSLFSSHPTVVTAGECILSMTTPIS